MQKYNGNQFAVRFFIILISVFAIAPLLGDNVHADMVIAPSKIVINTTNAVNYRNGNDTDTTIKALIPYPVGTNCVVVIDGPDFTLNLNDGENGNFAEIDGLTARYCYIDSVLIIEFDRDKVIEALKNSNLMDSISTDVDLIIRADVDGNFIVTCPDPIEEDDRVEIDINETSEVFIYNPSAR